jgi:hypothetical protein
LENKTSFRQNFRKHFSKKTMTRFRSPGRQLLRFYLFTTAGNSLIAICFALQAPAVTIMSERPQVSMGIVDALVEVREGTGGKGQRNKGRAVRRAKEY